MSAFSFLFLRCCVCGRIERECGLTVFCCVALPSGCPAMFHGFVRAWCVVVDCPVLRLGLGRTDTRCSCAISTHNPGIHDTDRTARRGTGMGTARALGRWLERWGKTGGRFDTDKTGRRNGRLRFCIRACHACTHDRRHRFIFRALARRPHTYILTIAIDGRRLCRGGGG